MPWTAEDFKGFSKDLTDEQAERAARMANSILRSCLERGGQQDECERVAIATALDRVKAGEVMQYTEAKYTDRPWDGSFSRFDIDQLLRAVPRAIAAWARAKAREEGRDVVKNDLALPYKEPDGTININAVRNALARLSQVTGIPRNVLADARAELQGVLASYKKAKGLESRFCQKYGALQTDALQDIGNGMVYVDMVTCRAGLFDFTNDTGEKYIALEHPDDVFSEAFIEQHVGLPIVLDHDPGDWVDASNIGDRIVGVVLGAWRDQDVIKARGVLWGKKAIEAVRGGWRELSKGYMCDVVDESGVWDGQEYNKRHTNMQLNHIAIVEQGKCGETCRILVESTVNDHVPDKVCGHMCGQEKQVNKEHKETMIKLMLNGKEFVISDESGAQLFQEALNKHLEELAKAKEIMAEKEQREKDLAQAAERIAALEAEGKLYKEKCVEFENRVRALESGEALQALVTERLNLVRHAEERIPGFTAAGKTNRQIMVEVIKSIDAAFDDSGRSDGEAKAVYEALVRAEAALGVKAVKAVGLQQAASEVAKRLLEARERSRGRSARLPEEPKTDNK